MVGFRCRGPSRRPVVTERGSAKLPRRFNREGRSGVGGLDRPRGTGLMGGVGVAIGKSCFATPVLPLNQLLGDSTRLGSQQLGSLPGKSQVDGQPDEAKHSPVEHGRGQAPRQLLRDHIPLRHDPRRLTFCGLHNDRRPGCDQQDAQSGKHVDERIMARRSQVRLLPQRGGAYEGGDGMSGRADPGRRGLNDGCSGRRRRARCGCGCGCGCEVGDVDAEASAPGLAADTATASAPASLSRASDRSTSPISALSLRRGWALPQRKVRSSTKA